MLTACPSSSAPGAEDGGADPYHRRALLDGHLVVGASCHGQVLERQAVAQLRARGSVAASPPRVARRRIAIRPRTRRPGRPRRASQRASSPGHAPFLRLVPEIHLQQDVKAALRPLISAPAQLLRPAEPIHRVDPVEERAASRPCWSGAPRSGARAPGGRAPRSSRAPPGTRFSPRAATPAATAIRTRSASIVLETAMRSTWSGERPARAHARATASWTRPRLARMSSMSGGDSSMPARAAPPP